MNISKFLCFLLCVKRIASAYQIRKSKMLFFAKLYFLYICIFCIFFVNFIFLVYLMYIY